MNKDKPTSISDGRFILEKKLGEGAFGEVHRGTDTRTGDHVAIKLEEARVCQLKAEAQFLDMLRRPSQRQGFVELLFFGRTGSWNAMVMELLGKSLEECVASSGGSLAAPTTTIIAQQCLHRIEYLHSKGVVHRDIKPENFMWGSGHKVTHLYLIDFGLSCRYWDKKHAKMTTGNSLTGTARYASVNTHRGCTQSRRDDLEAIAHMLIYILRGALPWSGLAAKTQKEKFQKIADTKEAYNMDELCQGHPDEFKAFLRYSRDLDFKSRPDYEMLQSSFTDLRHRLGILEDWELPWLEGEDIDRSRLVPLCTPEGIQQPDDVIAARQSWSSSCQVSWFRRNFGMRTSSSMDKE
eukprot:CAMPEP_0115245044 /NCGR_PEP_ID=MMETSP0270-20121206/40304_1 /TAXON_ID=71861 /ORGANISM="Scrippsiella trochoidea, Strain CCMP3099" /LENGTH=350 /DNA_ID=CAMNT_0002660207 /DNA_START=31 /DNA_END=1083 /DNA_ORIENTATION=+